MPKFLFRIIGLFLVPCLIADPAMASAFVGYSLAPLRATGDGTRFQQEALAAPPVAGFLKPLRSKGKSLSQLLKELEEQKPALYGQSSSMTLVAREKKRMNLNRFVTNFASLKKSDLLMDADLEYEANKFLMRVPHGPRSGKILEIQDLLDEMNDPAYPGEALQHYLFITFDPQAASSSGLSVTERSEWQKVFSTILYRWSLPDVPLTSIEKVSDIEAKYIATIHLPSLRQFYIGVLWVVLAVMAFVTTHNRITPRRFAMTAANPVPSLLNKDIENMHIRLEYWATRSQTLKDSHQVTMLDIQNEQDFKKIFGLLETALAQKQWQEKPVSLETLQKDALVAIQDYLRLALDEHYSPNGLERNRRTIENLLQLEKGELPYEHLSILAGKMEEKSSDPESLILFDIGNYMLKHPADFKGSLNKKRPIAAFPALSVDQIRHISNELLNELLVQLKRPATPPQKIQTRNGAVRAEKSLKYQPIRDMMNGSYGHSSHQSVRPVRRVRAAA